MKKILIVNPFGLGDAIFSLHLAEALRAQLPDAAIDFLGNERTEPLLKMDETLRRVHALDRDGLRQLWPAHPGKFWKASSALFGTMRGEHYDVLFDLSLGREFSFYAFCMGIRRRIGFDYKNRGRFLTEKIAIDGYAHRAVAEQQLDLLPLAGLAIPELSGRLPLRIPNEASASARRRLEKAGFASGSFLAVSPGGGRSWGKNAVYKQWNPERFAEVVRGLSAKGIRTVLLGDETERLLLESVRALSRTDALVCADLLIAETAAVLCASRGLAANDGGLVHLASALGVKAAAIFGPVDAAVYGPFRPPAGSRTLAEPVPCGPCYAHFRFPPCEHARICLENLPAERVLAAALEMA